MTAVPQLLVVTEPALMGSDPVAALRALLAGAPASPEPGGAAPWMLEWRDKDAAPRDVYHRLLALADAPGLPIVVNDRVDVALAAGRGVHLTETSLPTRVARSLLPAGTLLGRSTHDLVAALRAAAEGADYVVFGPVFDTPSKRAYGPPQGLTALAEVAAAVSIPVLAIGGIDARRVGACRGAGAHGVAVIRAVWDDPAPHTALARLLEALGAPID